MKFTLDWLKDHLDTSADLTTITDTLTNIGLEIENVEDKSEEFKDFSVAKVIKAEKHPDADKLKVCQVKTKSGEFQVVCGAPNARQGMLGIFAPEIIHALNEINADASANIVSSSLPIVNPLGYLDNEYKNFVFNIQLTQKQKADLYAQDVLYDQLQGQENLEDLLGNYLQSFINQ